eukprot:4219179-Amphidinium_carterae.1
MNGHLGHQSLQKIVMIKDGMSIRQPRDRQIRGRQIRVSQKSLNQKTIGSMSENIREHSQMEELSESECTQGVEAIMEEQSHL